MVLTRGDVEGLDSVEEGQLGDQDVPELPEEFAFTTGDWLGLLKPTGNEALRSARAWKRLSGMVAVVSGIALLVVTFSFGSPVADYDVNLETSAGSTTLSSEPADAGEPTASTVAIDLGSGLDIELLDMAEASFLRLAPLEAPESTTSTTAGTTTTAARWSDPPIPPESEWIDAGNGVAVPDVLLRIRYCESTNNYRAAHAVSSARGAYQFLTKSWEWYGHAARYGVASADLATPAQQDEAAVLTLRRDGTRPWLASWSCWGSEMPAGYANVRPPPQPATTTTTAADSSTTTSESSTTTADSSTSSTTSSTVSSTSGTDTTDTTTDESTSSTTSGSTTSDSTSTDSMAESTSSTDSTGSTSSTSP